MGVDDIDFGIVSASVRVQYLSRLTGFVDAVFPAFIALSASFYARTWWAFGAYMADKNIGWILVHSHDQYPNEDFIEPREELKRLFKQGELLKWHWSRPSPLRIDGPYTLLFSYNGWIFGEGTGSVTHDVEIEGYNFAFGISEYKEIADPVALNDLPVPKVHRSLITLKPEILSAYRKLCPALT